MKKKGGALAAFLPALALILTGLQQVFTGAPKGNRRIEREIANVKNFVFRVLVCGDYLHLKAAFEKQKGTGQRE